MSHGNEIHSVGTTVTSSAEPLCGGRRPLRWHLGMYGSSQSLPWAPRNDSPVGEPRTCAGPCGALLGRKAFPRPPFLVCRKVASLSPCDLPRVLNVSLLLAQSYLTLCDPIAYSSPAPLCMEFSREECWSGHAFPSPGDRPNTGLEPRSPELQADSLPSEPPGKPLGSEGQIQTAAHQGSGGTAWTID